VRPRHCFEIAEITRVANVSEMKGEREGILSWNSPNVIHVDIIKHYNLSKFKNSIRFV